MARVHGNSADACAGVRASCRRRVQPDVRRARRRPRSRPARRRRAGCCGSCRSAQSAPTSLATSGLCRWRRMIRRSTSSSIERRRPGVTAVGSSSRISSAKDSCLPLCGVARGQDQRVGVRRRAGGPAGCSACATLVTLCDSSMTTASHCCFSQVGEVAVALERVDRDDRPLEVGERVAGGRQLLPDPLDADRVEPDERQREPGPQLVLHLLEHVPRGDDRGCARRGRGGPARTGSCRSRASCRGRPRRRAGCAGGGSSGSSALRTAVCW